MLDPPTPPPSPPSRAELIAELRRQLSTLSQTGGDWRRVPTMIRLRLLIEAHRVWALLMRAGRR